MMNTSSSGRSAAGAAVQVQDLVVVRGRRTVLPGLSCTLRRGAITGLLGPSGCGKSTLIRSIVGVQQVDSGRVEVLGQPAGSATLRSQIGYVTQEASVYDNLSVRDNVAFFSRVLGVPVSDADRVIDQVGLADHGGSLAGQLSGGQRSRVSLAVALLGEPPLLVLDEPTVGLDPVLRVELWRLFADLAAAGATILVSSHAMDEAARCDDLILMRSGEILAAGTPAQLCDAAGAQDIESVFLKLVRARGEAA